MIVKVMRLLVLISATIACVRFGISIVYAQDVKGGTSTSDSTFLPPGATADTTEDQPGFLEKEFKRKAWQFHLLTLSSEPVKVTSQHQEYRADEHIIIYSGDVHVQRGPLSLQANRVLVDTWANKATMEGNVELRFEQDYITADRGIFEFDTKELHLENCQGIIQPELFFEAEILERLYPDPDTERGRYYFKNVLFTPCSQLVPQWSMQAREVYATAEEYMHLYGTAFLIHNIPFLWFPYWFYPIKTERSTGFLVPSFGYSTRDGWRFKNEFFWAITDHMDLTLTHDFKEEYRNEGKAEYRYALGPLSLGSFSYRYIHEKKDPYTEDIIPDDERDIHLVRGYQIHHFPWEIDWHLNLDYYSNDRINRLYGENNAAQVQSFTNSWAGFTRNWSKVMTSLSANYYQSSQLWESNDRKLDGTIQRLPSFSLAVPNTRIGTSGFYYSFRSQAENIVMYDKYLSTEPGLENDELAKIYFDEIRLYCNPRLRHIFPKKKTWFLITTDLDFWFTYWSEKRDYLFEPGREYTPEEWQAIWDHYNNYSNSLARFYLTDYTVWETLDSYEPHIGARTYYSGNGLVREAYQASVDFAGPQFYRIFDTSTVFDNVLKLKHRFWPGVTYTYVPYIDQSRIINFDYYIDYIEPAEGLTYYIKSDLIGRVYDPLADAITVRSLCRFTIQQTYDFRLDRYYNTYLDRYHDDPDNHPRPPRTLYPYSDITTRLEFFPSTRIWFLTTGSYDPYYDTLKRLNLDIYLQLKKWFFRSGWGLNKGIIFDPRDPNTQFKENYEYDDIEYAYLAAGGQLSGHWAASINTNYNLTEEKFHHFNSSIIYDAQCWGVSLSFLARQYQDQTLYGTNTGKQDPPYDEYNFMLTIHLKHVGDVGGYDTVEGLGMAP
ncbi:LPS-assembly protein LptD [bacterium]|nr:LPS-assembly protein LptD [bacterium]